jgi:hypothetical protein
MHVVVVMMVMMVVVMVVMMMHLGGGRRRLGGGSSRRCLLRERITREPDSESGRGDKALEHGSSFLIEKDPSGLHATHWLGLPELNVN